MLRTVIFAAILPLLVLSGCDSNAPRKNADQEVIALERSALDKWSQGNTLGYIEISADDLTWFDFTPGRQPRIEGLEAMRNFLAPLGQQIPHHTYELVDPRVQVYGSTAILTFHWSATTTEGQPLPRWKATSVYHWKDGKWRMVHGHWSEVQGA
jgi:ketosteroid isomerase-like protein